MLKLLDIMPHFRSERDYVLAIITSTEGSTYRKSGAMMLMDSANNYWGLLSGGCLEGDILQNSQDCFEHKRDKPLRYDMRGDEDLIWGLGLGCDGAVDILLKYLPSANNHLGFFEVLSAVEKGQNFTLQILPDHNLKFIESSKQTIVDESLEGLLVPLNAPLNLLICGASPDVEPVTSLANQLGWKTTVVDHRKEFANEQLLPKANRVLHIKRSEWNAFELAPFDAAVIMSHQFERDQDYLSRIIDSRINYVGLLGPRKRRDKLLSEIGIEFNQIEGRVFGPIGLDIGADTPETIALAIVAEIQAVKSNKKVGFCYQDETR